MRKRYAIAILLALSLLAGCTSVPTETETEAETKPDLPPVTETDTAEPETESELETAAPDTTPEQEPYPDAPYHYKLSADVYPTLDFTYHADYMNYALCDFAILENGNLLLLTMSESVTEIAPDGSVVGTYTYPLAENGWTAYGSPQTKTEISTSLTAGTIASIRRIGMGSCARSDWIPPTWRRRGIFMP